MRESLVEFQFETRPVETKSEPTPKRRCIINKKIRDGSDKPVSILAENPTKCKIIQNIPYVQCVYTLSI